MNLTAILLLAAVLHVNASGIAQTVTYSAKSEPLAKVFSAIEEQTGYAFFYREEDLKSSKPVSVELKDADINTSLEAVLANQLLQYEIEGNTILISTKPVDIKSVLAKVLVDVPPVSGVVRGPDGQPLGGVNIIVKSTKRGTTSSGDGKFSIEAKEGDVLIFTSIGYGSKEIKVGAYNEIGIVQLVLSDSKLDEVQIIAYGKTTQRLSTGNVTTIKANAIEKQPVNNPLLALQGRVPGLFIEQATGFAGTGVKVRIQGQNSMANGNDPLYVIDGVPFSSQLLPGSNSILGNSGAIGLDGNFIAGNPLNFINPSDIESIDVLKDADATAIYGSRAANGAILITTKKGKTGEINVKVNLQTGRGDVARKLDLLNSAEYLELRKEAFNNDNINFNDPPYNTEPYKTTVYPDLSGFWNNQRYTDWQDELIGGTAQFNDLQTSVSGGSNTTNFLISAGYHNEGNVFPGKHMDVKSSLHFNINSASNNQKFKIQLSGSYLENNNRLPVVDMTYLAMTLPPVAPNLYNEDGTINWQPNSLGTSTFKNPLEDLNRNYKYKVENLISNAILSYKLLPGLEIKSSLGYNKLRSNTYYAATYLRPEYQSLLNRWTSTFGNSSNNSWSIEPQLTYTRNISKGNLEMLIGSTILQNNSQQYSLNASGFNSQEVMEDLKSATVLTPVSSVNNSYKYFAVFARINYNWKDKYILNLTGRRDGSSRFGSENRFHNFSAIGAAWIFTKEDVIKDIQFLSFGKLRGSYGTTGSDQISDYQYLSLYDVIGGITAPYQGVNGYQPNRLTNPYLQWEETRKLQFGLDLGFFNDRILINTSFFNNKSSNQLISNALPSVAGFYGISANFPATVQNSGWELSLSSSNISTKSFRWSSSINITIPKNKLVDFPGLAESSYGSQYIIGQSINIEKKYHYFGVDRETGIFMVTDRNGNPTSNPLPNGYPDNDAIVIINRDPKFYGGLHNTFSYNNFELDVLFQFTKQIGLNYFLGNIMPGGLINQPDWMVDRWKKTGDDVTMQKSSSGFNLFTSYAYTAGSDVVWSDASYIRLKNVSISWSLPEKLRKAIRLRAGKLYMQGQNLFTITNYLGLDPETKSSTTLPPLRVVTIGVQIGL